MHSRRAVPISVEIQSRCQLNATPLAQSRVNRRKHLRKLTRQLVPSGLVCLCHLEPSRMTGESLRLSWSTAHERASLWLCERLTWADVKNIIRLSTALPNIGTRRSSAGRILLHKFSGPWKQWSSLLPWSCFGKWLISRGTANSRLQHRSLKAVFVWSRGTTQDSPSRADFSVCGKSTDNIRSKNYQRRSGRRILVAHFLQRLLRRLVRQQQRHSRRKAAK